ncbi:hypothetical protein BJ981_005239 [Sphaerisporangium krabiense]|uniref:Uncharacterized protein n=1 Tax=Sphaerisporangium krabiense TaxID=763782 RepID=A0A7W8Z926_9ACTN|nr:hypothetical protein [Sphaerisporangium krabiense]
MPGPQAGGAVVTVRGARRVGGHVEAAVDTTEGTDAGAMAWQWSGSRRNGVRVGRPCRRNPRGITPAGASGGDVDPLEGARRRPRYPRASTSPQSARRQSNNPFRHKQPVYSFLRTTGNDHRTAPGHMSLTHTVCNPEYSCNYTLRCTFNVRWPRHDHPPAVHTSRAPTEGAVCTPPRRPSS